MDVLNRLLINLQQMPPRSEEETSMLDAAQVIAASVGAMADVASGGNFLGSAEAWTIGRVFADAGKAGAA